MQDATVQISAGTDICFYFRNGLDCAYRYRLRGFVKLTFKGSIEADRKATLADTWMVVLVMPSRWASSLAVEPCSSPFGHDHGMNPAFLWGTT